MSAAIAEAERRLEQDVETWNPRKDQLQPRAIAGKIVARRVKPGRGYEGADAETVLLEAADGKLWLVWLFAKVLQEEFFGLGLGQWVVVKYEGHVEGRERGYEHYRVELVVQDQQQAPAAVSSPVGEPQREPEPPTPQCEACHFYEPHHADGCPNGIPF